MNTLININRQENFERARKKINKHLDQPLTLELIKDIQNIITGQPNEYRTGFNPPSVKNNGKIVYTGLNSGTTSIKAEMQKFLNWYDPDIKSPITTIVAKLHWGLVKIHPFIDGNGRTARLLVSFVLLNKGFDQDQCLKLEAYFTSSREEYFNALNDDQLTYNGFDKVSSNWLEYIYNGFFINKIIKKEN